MAQSPTPEPPPGARTPVAPAWRKFVGWAVFVVVCAAVGFSATFWLDELGAQIWGDALPAGFLGLLLGIGLGVVLVVVALFVHVLLHETGHLIGGLLTGYRFGSFQIGPLIWIAQDGRIRLRRYQVAGMGGQCLMVPPPMVDGNFPHVVYNIAGPIANLLAAGVCGGLALLPDPGLVRLILVIFTVMGLITGLTNLIPLRSGTVHNDGANLASIRGDADARRALWVQLQVMAASAAGVRVKDMPAQWFEVPPAGKLGNPLVAAMGVLTAGRLLDGLNLDAADALITDLLTADSGLIEVHRRLLIVDRVFLELVGANRPEVLAALDTREQRQFEASMKQFPSVLRTDHARALLAERDAERAARVRAGFEQMARSYPRPVELVGERELMSLAESRAQG